MIVLEEVMFLRIFVGLLYFHLYKTYIMKGTIQEHNL